MSNRLLCICRLPTSVQRIMEVRYCLAAISPCPHDSLVNSGGPTECQRPGRCRHLANWLVRTVCFRLAHPILSTHLITSVETFSCGLRLEPARPYVLVAAVHDDLLCFCSRRLRAHFRAPPRSTGRQGGGHDQELRWAACSCPPPALCDAVQLNLWCCPGTIGAGG